MLKPFFDRANADDRRRGKTMGYRHETTSLAGLVQLLAANLLPHGFYFYVTGRVPTGKDPAAIDAKLIGKYGCNLSRTERSRRKQAGTASVHYLRCDSFWILIATHGKHRFFDEEGDRVQDLRRIPLRVGDYSLTVREGDYLKKSEEDVVPRRDGRPRARVLICRERYKELRAFFLDIAVHRSEDKLRAAFFGIPFEPYAPVRKQLLNLLRLVNEERKGAGLSRISPDCLRYRRRIVRPFDDDAVSAGTPEAADRLMEAASMETGNHAAVLF